MKLVTIIMAARNSEKFVSQAIESVLMQTYKNLEFIIIDDFSKDSTFKIIRNYQKNDKRIRAYRNSFRKGPAESRNIAIKKAKGEWISVIDSDDIFFPKKIEKQINYVNKNINKNVIFIGSNLLFIDKNGKHVAYYKYKNESDTIKSEILKNKSFPPHSSYFIKKKYLKKINGYNSRYLMAPDYDLLLRLQNFTNMKFAVCKDVLTKVRIHDQNRSLKKINNFSQLDFAILANICFQINKQFKVNPAESLSDNQWKEFMNMFKIFINNLNYYKFLVNKLKFKRRKRIPEYIKYFFSLNFIKSQIVGHIIPGKFQKKFFLIYKDNFIKS